MSDPENSRYIPIGPVTQFTINHDGDIFCNDNAREYLINGQNAKILLGVLQLAVDARFTTEAAKEMLRGD